MLPQKTSTFVRGDEASEVKKQKPFPPKAKRLFVIFAIFMLAVISLPVLLELSGVAVSLGPWLSLLITLPVTLLAMIGFAFLRDSLTSNLISAAVVTFACVVAYGLEFSPGQEETALSVRGAAPAMMAILLAHFWFSLKTSLRDLHYLVAEGRSMQDVLAQYQQASVIKKAGGTPVMDQDGNVVAQEDVIPRKGFRPKRGAAKATKGKKKRKKPKLR